MNDGAVGRCHLVAVRPRALGQDRAEKLENIRAGPFERSFILKLHYIRGQFHLREPRLAMSYRAPRQRPSKWLHVHGRGSDTSATASAGAPFGVVANAQADATRSLD